MVLENRKEKYQNFCNQNQDLPLFLRYSWYKALFDDDWDVILVEKNGNIQGFLPYILTKKKTFSLIRPPMLTPYQGVWLNYPKGQKNTSKLSFEKEVISDIINALPQTDAFQQKFIPEFTNWLPFYWADFNQTTRYTYIIDDLSSSDKIFEDFRDNIRREIRKAEKSLIMETISDINLLYELKRDVYRANNEGYPISKDLLERVNNYCLENNCGELIAAKDIKGKIHSILLYVWDENSAYYLHGGTNADFKTSGSMSLLLWEAIKRSSSKTKAFNFEGSMMESIERYFRAFGGKQVPYFEISKTNSKLLKLLKH